MPALKHITTRLIIYFIYFSDLNNFINEKLIFILTLKEKITN